jgi:Glycosyl transferase family 90
MWVMPDFGYWSWPLDLVGEYQQIRSDMRGSELDWEKKIPKVLWRGAVKTNEEVRGALMRVAKRKSWADVDQVNWKNRKDVTAGSDALPIKDHCKYQFLMHTEGKTIFLQSVGELWLTTWQDAVTLVGGNTFSTARPL